MPSDAAAAPLSVRGVWKRFGGFTALADISLDFARGSIHALVGANGAGKSTLLGIMAGRFAPSHGAIYLEGTRLPLGRPRDIATAGIAAIYQELTIAANVPAIENVFLGRIPHSKGFLARRVMLERYEELCRTVGTWIPPQMIAGKLPVAHQQLLEIMRALERDAQIVLLDEPTSALGQARRGRLFDVMRGLRDLGKTLIFVSHDLDEILAIADVVTVFRDGRMVRTAPVGEWSKGTLLYAMLGRAGADARAAGGRESRGDAAHSEAALEVDRLVTLPGRDAISFGAKRGEIVGLAGLDGSGRTSVLRALAGARPAASGRVNTGSGWRDARRTVRQAQRAGVGFVPEDRRKEGVIASLTAATNIALLNLNNGPLRPLNEKSCHRDAVEPAARVHLSKQYLSRRAGALSGGNQQKLLLARWLSRRLKVLLVDQPTRGVDVGAKEEILRTLRTVADAGTTVIATSSELEELEQICDRVLVLRRGAIAAELSRAHGDLTVSNMLKESFGGSQGADRRPGR